MRLFLPKSHTKAKGLQTEICNPLISLARPEGLEPPAYGFEDRASEFPKLLNLG